MIRGAAILVVLTSAMTAVAPKSTPDLKLSIANGRNTFHIGERIPIVFSFTGPDDGSFTVTLTGINRLGGFPFDEFAVSPTEGTADPRAQLLAQGGAFSMQSGQGVLSTKPVTRTANLNEWIRFDSAGTFTVTVTSHRVGPTGKNNLFSDEHTSDVRSKSFRLNIVPATPQWQKVTLARILHDLASPQNPDAETPPLRSAALEDLCYLASPEAIAALAATVRDDQIGFSREASDCLIGLSRPNREVALKAMNGLIDDPTFPVSTAFLDVFVQVQLDDLPLPVQDNLDSMRDFSEKIEAAKEPLSNTAWDIVAAALPHKVEPARGATAQTVLALTPNSPSPHALAVTGAILRASFPALSDAEKTKMLVDQWEIIRSRELLPQLRQLSHKSGDDPEPDLMIPGSGSPHELRAAALHRWYEFEPDAATREIVNQIGSATPLLTAKDLAFLPPQAFPQFENLWFNAFAEAHDTSQSDLMGGLLIRFGSGAVAAQMLAQTSGDHPDNSGNHESEAEAYIIRFDPQTARRLLQRTPAEDMECLGGGLNYLSHLVQAPVLTEAALAAIHSPCPSAVSDAATYLAKYGDDSARQPLLDRYLDWSKRWAGKPEEDHRRSTEDLETAEHREQREDHDLGWTLAEALLVNQGWIPDDDLIATVIDHCSGKNVCAGTKSLAKPNFEITATRSPDWNEYRIGSLNIPTFELFEAKLDQFPKGTAFTLPHSDSGYPGLQRAVDAQLRTVLEKHGMRVAQKRTDVEGTSASRTPKT